MVSIIDLIKSGNSAVNSFIKNSSFVKRITGGESIYLPSSSSSNLSTQKATAWGTSKGVTFPTYNILTSRDVSDSGDYYNSENEISAEKSSSFLDLGDSLPETIKLAWSSFGQSSPVSVSNITSGVKTQSNMNKVIKSSTSNLSDTVSSLISKSYENQAVFNKTGNSTFETALANAKATGQIGSVANTLQSIGYPIASSGVTPVSSNVQRISYTAKPTVTNTQVQKSYSRSTNISDAMNSAAAKMGSSMRW